MSFDGKIASGSGEPMTMRIDNSADKSLLSLGASGNAINISNMKTADGYEFSVATIQEGEEAARLEGKIKKEGDRINKITMEFSAPAQ